MFVRVSFLLSLCGHWYPPEVFLVGSLNLTLTPFPLLPPPPIHRPFPNPCLQPSSLSPGLWSCTYKLFMKSCPQISPTDISKQDPKLYDLHFQICSSWIGVIVTTQPGTPGSVSGATMNFFLSFTPYYLSVSKSVSFTASSCSHLSSGLPPQWMLTFIYFLQLQSLHCHRERLF